MLLDINVLLALAWPNHQFHSPASTWFKANDRWFTCALTELGFIRISSNKAFSEHAKSPPDAAALLLAMKEHGSHQYIDKLPSLEPSSWQHVTGARQTTDVYLAHVAKRNNLKLATFDRRIAAYPQLRATIHTISVD